jgi:hypothetical protein
MQTGGRSGYVCSRVLTQLMFVVNISPNIYARRNKFEILWGVVTSILYCLNRKFTKYKQANNFKYQDTQRHAWHHDYKLETRWCVTGTCENTFQFHYNKNLSYSRNMETCLTLAELCFTVSSSSSYILVAPTWSIGNPWNASFHFSFFNLRQSVGLLGRGISPSQGRYLTQTQTAMPRVGFEPTIPVFERAKTFHALDRAASVIGEQISGYTYNSPESIPIYTATHN